MEGVVVFGRQPIPGRVKTRLESALGPAVSASVYAALLAYTLHAARSSGVRVVLSLAEPASSGWRPPVEVEVEAQRPGDLGERMADAFARRFAEGYSRVVVVGSDCAQMGPGHLRSAFDYLRETPVVIGPATDGGYWLVGQSSPGTDLFVDVPWSSPNTMETTRARLSQAGAAWTELEVLNDVDTIDDLKQAMDGNLLQESLRRELDLALSSG